ANMSRGTSTSGCATSSPADRRSRDAIITDSLAQSSMEKSVCCVSNACPYLSRCVPRGEASRRAGCRRSARPVRRAGMGNGALPNGPSYRAYPRLYQRHGAGGKTWHAYLSTQAADGKPAVDARDRIGNGPWQNFKGEVVAQNVNDLHSDNNKLGMNTPLTERGQIIAGVGFGSNRHDVLTGSTPEGRAFPAGEDRTCRNGASSTQGAAMVGHIDRKGLRDDAPSRSWNSSHPSRGPDGG